MTKLEALLRISIVQAELAQLAEVLDPHTRATLLYASRVGVDLILTRRSAEFPGDGTC